MIACGRYHRQQTGHGRKICVHPTPLACVGYSFNGGVTGSRLPDDKRARCRASKPR